MNRCLLEPIVIIPLFPNEVHTWSPSIRWSLVWGLSNIYKFGLILFLISETKSSNKFASWTKQTNKLFFLFLMWMDIEIFWSWITWMARTISRIYFLNLVDWHLVDKSVWYLCKLVDRTRSPVLSCRLSRKQNSRQLSYLKL